MNIIYKNNPSLKNIKEGFDGNITIKGKFFNCNKPVKSPIKDVLRWKLTPNPQKHQKLTEEYKLNVINIAKIDKTKDTIYWLGHSSFLIVINGITIITDPVFFDIPTAKRLAEVPLLLYSFTHIDDSLDTHLKDIDYILLSHDHRDHCDIKSIKLIVDASSDVEILAGLNMASLIHKKVSKNVKVQEAAWYQKYNIKDNVDIFFTPAKHWARRGVFDFNKRLWGSFIIKNNEKSLFFAGDTTYDNQIFKDINSTFDSIDICLLPIGAYSPAFIMAQSHCTPEEAYQIFNDLKGKLFIPMHYGTYDLSDEPLGEPVKRITKCFNDSKDKFKKVDIGENLYW